VLVAAAFSRLLIDPNRPLASDTLVRCDAGGEAIALNAGAIAHDAEGQWDVSAAPEVRRRVAEYWVPFHLCLGAVKAAVRPVKSVLKKLCAHRPSKKAHARVVHDGKQHRVGAASSQHSSR